MYILGLPSSVENSILISLVILHEGSFPVTKTLSLRHVPFVGVLEVLVSSTAVEYGCLYM